MKFLDEVKIKVIGGFGGNGCSSFRREKYLPFGGPDGGNGGNGGSVWAEVDPNLNTLIDLAYHHIILAGNGSNGSGSNRTGRDGEDVVFYTPSGTTIFSYVDDKFQLLGEMSEENPRMMVAKGGSRGRGNTSFKTNTNNAPRFSTKGGAGENLILILKYKSSADIGLIGEPNAGKSSLIQAYTGSKSKVGNYAFTTLYPEIGVLEYDNEKISIIDIPGLIYGASVGRGLGISFLRHVEKCKVLAIVIDVTVDNVIDSLKLVEQELFNFDARLLQKPRVILLNKSDLLEPDIVQMQKNRIMQESDSICIAISAISGSGLKFAMESVLIPLSR